MKYFQEVTDWGAQDVPNHIYYLKDDKSRMVGYIKQGSKKLFKFKNPIAIDVRGRKFVELKDLKAEPDSVYFATQEKPKNEVIAVKGSNGKEYYLEKVGNRYTCTCPGFTFRHTCKHVADYNK